MDRKETKVLLVKKDLKVLDFKVFKVKKVLKATQDFKVKLVHSVEQLLNMKLIYPLKHPLILVKANSD